MQTKFGALHSHHQARVSIAVRASRKYLLVVTGPGAMIRMHGRRAALYGDMSGVELQLPHGVILRCRTGLGLAHRPARDHRDPAEHVEY